VESQLQLHRDSLARLAQFGSMAGELAAAVAHEVNQPLLAAGIYAGLVADAIEGPRVRHVCREKAALMLIFVIAEEQKFQLFTSFSCL
jgi:two-component system, LuxR family, sensor kinase FixL